MKYDYTWSCECNEIDTTPMTFLGAMRFAKEHFLKCDAKVISVDQYDLEAGELSGVYWNITRGAKGLLVKKI